jgi:hypothetical protein
MTRSWVDSNLLEAVKRLAAPADEQEAWLRASGTWPSLDELALELDDVFEAARALGNAPPEYFAAVAGLDALLSEMSGQKNARLWNGPALGLPEWQRVRELARLALAAAE